jgi:hypothetical protein
MRTFASSPRNNCLIGTVNFELFVFGGNKIDVTRSQDFGYQMFACSMVL